MKNLTLFILLFACLTSFAQEIDIQKDPKTGRYAYSEVVTVTHNTKSELFNKAKMWAALYYKDAKEVIQIQDEENGIMVLNGSTETGWMGKPGYISYTLTIKFKDSRYKIDLTNFSYYSDGSGNVHLDSAVAFRKSLTKNMNKKLGRTVFNLKMAMEKKVVAEDW